MKGRHPHNPHGSFLKRRKKTSLKFLSSRVSSVAQQVKNLRHRKCGLEIWVQSLGPENPLGEEMTTHSRILAWRIPRTDSPWGRLQSDTTEHPHKDNCREERDWLERN